MELGCHRDTNILPRDQKTVGREDVVVWAGAWSGHDAGNEESGEEVDETHCELWTLMDDETGCCSCWRWW